MSGRWEIQARVERSRQSWFCERGDFCLTSARPFHGNGDADPGGRNCFSRESCNEAGLRPICTEYPLATIHTSAVTFDSATRTPKTPDWTEKPSSRVHRI
jgi:hypothetical protein